MSVTFSAVIYRKIRKAQKNKVTILGVIRYTSFSYMVEMSRMVATDIKGGLDESL